MMSPKKGKIHRRYTDLTRRRSAHRDPKRTKHLILACLIPLAVIIVALIWGNHLKAESDAYRAQMEAGAWTLDEEIAIPIPVATPSVNAGYAPPSGKMQTSELLDYQAVTLDLGSCLAPLPYSPALPEASGMTVASGAPDLSSEIARFQNAGLHVIGVFTVTSFDTSDITERTLRQGQEMTLLSLFAKAGIDDILLLGIPTGSDALDVAATDYLRKAEALLASVPAAVPALGIALYPAAFSSGEVSEDGDILYTGGLTPGRMLSVCDYLALDLRGLGTQTSDILHEMQYAYVRYDLRLLTSRAQPETTAAAVSHGFEQIFEFGS